MANDKPVFELKNVSLRIGEKLILNDLTVQINDKKITGIIGPSGSGKSTLLRMLSNLLVPSSGEIYYKGKKITEFSPTLYRKKVAYVQQRPYLFPGTVRDNLLYGPKIWNIKYSEEELIELLDLVHLEEEYLNRDVNNLSEGEKQRVNIARSLANKPEALLLDEPTSALDIISTQIVEELLISLKNKGLKIMIVTHDLEQTKRISDEVLVLNNGIILDYIDIREFLHSRDENEIRSYFEKKGGQ